MTENPSVNRYLKDKAMDHTHIASLPEAEDSIVPALTSDDALRVIHDKVTDVWPEITFAKFRRRARVVLHG